MQEPQQQPNVWHKQTDKGTVTVNVLYTTGLHQEVYAAAFEKKQTQRLTMEVCTLYDNWMADAISFKDQYSEHQVGSQHHSGGSWLDWRRPSGRILLMPPSLSEQTKLVVVQ